VSELLGCCGSRKWADAMAAAWPFADTEAMLRTSDEICARLDTDDWLEAFGAHPKIGARASSAWSLQEQSGVASATADQVAELERLNRVYEERFGYIFIICASGKTTGEFLAALWERLGNAPGIEILVAAEEQRQITRLRLLKLVAL
jgi:OHCU decarboxylase